MHPFCSEKVAQKYIYIYIPIPFQPPAPRLVIQVGCPATGWKWCLFMLFLKALNMLKHSKGHDKMRHPTGRKKPLFVASICLYYSVFIRLLHEFINSILGLLASTCCVRMNWTDVFLPQPRRAHSLCGSAQGSRGLFLLSQFVTPTSKIPVIGRIFHCSILSVEKSIIRPFLK